MTRCKYCHTVHELDAKGRCQSCADAGNATRAGLSYGDYIASRDAAHLRPIPLPAPKPEPVSRANAIKTCPDCKDEYARAYSREYKRRKKQKGNAR